MERHAKRKQPRPWPRDTASRRAVMLALDRLHPHPSVSEILREARNLAPTLGRATLFRALRQLTAAGQLRPVVGRGGRTAYLRLQDGRHHHFICLRCGKTQELSICPVCYRLQETVEADVLGHLVELYGICSDCRARV
jgi:Fe2+ or Zn2+ uptake regulation protein